MILGRLLNSPNSQLLLLFIFMELTLCDLMGSDILQTNEGGYRGLTRENVRLAEHHLRSPFSGRLEVYHDKFWWSICYAEDSFGEWTLPEVVCRKLGNPGAMVYTAANLEYGYRKAKIDCKKSENFIVECEITKNYNCSEVAIISCYFPGYIGCFSDCVEGKDWCRPDFEELNYPTVESYTIQGCLEACREWEGEGERGGNVYAAVSNGNRCSCGRDFSQGVGEGFVGNENCDALCDGYGNRTCGGLDTPGYRTHAVFTTQVGICGGALSAIEGYVYSPGFPGSYVPNEECAWSIQVSEHNIQLELEISMLELNANDHIILEDNAGWSKVLNISAHLLNLPILLANLTSPVNIRFISDKNSSGGLGFVFKYTAINLRQNCELLSVENGKYVPVWPIYFPGDTITFFCYPGFRNLANQSICLKNFSWSDYPKCIRSTCIELPALAKGKYFPLWPEYYFGDSVRIVCNKGFTSSIEKIYCDENGTWTVINPECIFSNETLFTTHEPLTSGSMIRKSSESNSKDGGEKDYLLEALIVLFIFGAFIFYNTILRSYRKKKKREKELKHFLGVNRQHIIKIDHRSSQTIITVTNLAKNIHLQGFDIVYV